jgi:ankyrin repeat protein
MRSILDIVDNGSKMRDSTGFEILDPSDDSAESSGNPFVEDFSPSRLAAQKGHLAVMAELLDRQARRLKQRPTTTDSVWSDLDDAYLCLRDAASSGHIDIVDKLLNASVPVSKPDDQQHTPLQLAAILGHSDIVEKISTSASREDQQVALVLAIQIGDPTSVRNLIRNGTPLTTTKSGESPIHLAIESGNIQVFQELLEAEEARLIFRGEQENLINIAAERGHVPLLNHVFSGAYIRGIGSSSNRIFQRLMKSTIIWENDRVVDALLNNGLSCDIKDTEGLMPLHNAAKYGNRETVGLMIEAGAAIDSIASSGGTPLLIAIRAENRSACESLLELNANPDVADDDGLTPLSLACELGGYESVKLLLQYSADIGAVNSSGQTVLHTSVRSPEMMSILLEKDQGKHYINAVDTRHQTPLLSAASSGINRTVGYLLDANADLHHTDEDGYTALHLAVIGGHLETIKILIDKGADCNRKANGGQLCLHLAAERCYYNTLEYLLPLTDDINALDSKLGTPLAATGQFITQHVKSIRCAKLLLRKGAQINCFGGELHSPLQNAVWYENLGLARLLLENGAEVNAVGVHFQSALNAAVEAGHLGIIELLLSHNADPNIEYNNRSALENAIYSGHLPILETLLNAITDLDSKYLIKAKMRSEWPSRWTKSSLSS